MNKVNCVKKIIESLDWDTITDSINKVSVLKYTKEKLKIKLDSSINFLLVNNLTELACDFWLIRWKGGVNKSNEGLNGNLKIYFTFMMSDTTLKDNEIIIAPKPSPGETEVRILQGLLTKAIAAENYELCAIIKQQMMKLIDTKDE